MSREIRTILGYSARDLMRLTESTADDLVSAYRELVRSAKGGTSFLDLTDELAVFLDVASEVDPDGVFDDKLAQFLRDKILSDEFRDMARSIFALIGESRTFGSDLALYESLDDFDSLLQSAATEIKLSRDFTEAALVVSSFVASLRARAPDAAAAVDHALIEALEEMLGRLEAPLRKLAARIDD